MKNKFESLRIPGIVGKVSNSFKSYLIYSFSGDSLTVFTDQLQPGKWGAGFRIADGNLTATVLPGEGSGWFRSESDAIIYTLGYIKAKRTELPDHFRYAINEYIARLQSPKLF